MSPGRGEGEGGDLPGGDLPEVWGEDRIMDDVIPYGHCHCGCGRKTKISPHSGKPYKMLSEHYYSGLRNPRWRGGRTINAGGYLEIKTPGHSRAKKFGDYVLKHILIAEKALGKPLPPKAVIHHHGGDKIDGPLVICQDHAYHMFLEQRQRAYYACGHASWRMCKYCKKHDDPQNLYISPKNGTSNTYHRSCHAEYHRNRRRKKA